MIVKQNLRDTGTPHIQTSINRRNPAGMGVYSSFSNTSLNLSAHWRIVNRCLSLQKRSFIRDSVFYTPYTFSAKERDLETGYSYFGARYYDATLSVWLSVDPMTHKYPSMSAYMYCAGNPVMLVDPDGRDWYEIENKDTKETEIKWTDYKSQQEMDANELEGRYLGEAVVVFVGSEDEKLGEDGKLTGEGAKPAKVTIYGKNHKDDIKTYDGLTMTSDPDLFTPIASGDYKAFYQDMSTSLYGSRGSSLTYRISTLDGSLTLPTKDGVPNKDENSKNYGKPIKTSIFFHRTNWSGRAGVSIDSNGEISAVSKGCPVVDGRQWRNVERQLGKSNNIFIRVTR